MPLGEMLLSITLGNYVTVEHVSMRNLQTSVAFCFPLVIVETTTSAQQILSFVPGWGCLLMNHVMGGQFSWQQSLSTTRCLLCAWLFCPSYQLVLKMVDSHNFNLHLSAEFFLCTYKL